MNPSNNQTAVVNARKSAHPVIFLVLVLPFGIFTGYLTVTLAFLFSKAGISIQQIAGLAAINILPQIFKFLWAPFVDTTLSLKKWYIISTLITAACIFATGIVPPKISNLLFLTIMIVVSSFARTFLGAAANCLAAHDTPHEIKGRVGGYLQSGQLGGVSFGGGVGLWLSEHTAWVWLPGAVLALACVLCCTALMFINEPVSTVKAKMLSKTLINVARDIRQTLKTRIAMLGLILCIIPVGTAAAGNLFAAVAKDWEAGADTVALVTGIAGGVVTIIGCLIGGWLSDLIDRQKAYLLFGLLQAVCALGMAYCPHTLVMYITWTLIYTFLTGMNYAAWAAFTLEAIGRGAAASKFELFGGFSWSPIYLMIWVAGLAYSKWGANGMLITEAVCAFVAAILFVAIRAMIWRKKTTVVYTEPIASPL
jgi:PAT family beta-lactamase induction signal transducer AmpG